MKKLLLILLCLPMIGLGQDNIILRNGKEITSEVLQMDDENIHYKKFDNLEGPTYIKQKDDVFMIQYKNGTTDIINSTGTKQDMLSYGDYSRISINIIPYNTSLSNSEINMNFTGIEVELLSKNSHNSVVFGLFTGGSESPFKTHFKFGVNYYANHQDQFSYKVSSSINFGYVDILSENNISYPTIKEVNYTSFNLLFGPYYQVTQHLHVSLMVGPCLLFPKTNVEWTEPSFIFVRPAIGVRF
jgi:hypothetical protein